MCPHAYALTGKWLINERAHGWEFSDDLVVILIDVQPAAAGERIFLHCQGLKQSYLC